MLQQDKDHVLSLGAVFLEENIFYIPNFFNEELMVKIEKEIAEEKEWNMNFHGRIYPDMFYIKDLDVANEMQEIYLKFAEWPSFGKNYEDVENFEMQDVKWVKKRGTSGVPMMGPHWDGDPSPKYMNPKEVGTMMVPNRVKWGGVVYLNDDFEGGEINYIHLGIKFKPMKGSLIFHQGDSAKYRHDVSFIKGERYNMIFNFMYGDVNKPEDGEETFDFQGQPTSYGLIPS